MKLCIIGPEKRSDSEIELMELAKKEFDSVLYAPIEMIRIETCKETAAPFFKNINLLDFDVIFPRISKRNADFGYVLLKIFEQHKMLSPLSSESLLYGYNEYLLPFSLNNNKIQTPRTYLSMSRTAIEKNIDTMIYPAILKLPYSKTGTIVLDSAESAKGVVDTLETLKQPITLQETFKDATAISVLVIGNHTYAVKGKDSRYKLTTEERNTIMSVSQLLNATICQINLLKANDKAMVVGFNIKPKIEFFGNIYELNLLEKCVSYLGKRTTIKEENPIFNKVLEWLHDMRWKSHE
ncbi:MAG: hypothetical protein KAI18_00885 [Candidatus Aenigmarchaeota archaeon]|nr:hypothetical protein [Candidatus Aenigmarchaeota archaeon]